MNKLAKRRKKDKSIIRENFNLLSQTKY